MSRKRERKLRRRKNLDNNSSEKEQLYLEEDLNLLENTSLVPRFKLQDTNTKNVIFNVFLKLTELNNYDSNKTI